MHFCVVCIVITLKNHLLLLFVEARVVSQIVQCDLIYFKILPQHILFCYLVSVEQNRHLSLIAL